MNWLGGESDESKLARHMREIAAAEAETKSNPKAGLTVPEDLALIQARIRTGLPAAPMTCWRY